MKNMLTQFQMWNRKDVMLPIGSIKYLSNIENTFVSIRGSIKYMLPQCGIVTTLFFRMEAYNPYL